MTTIHLQGDLEMFNLEKALFEINDTLHNAGVIPDDRYVTQGSLLFSLVATLLLTPLIIKGLAWFPKSESSNKYMMFSMLAIQISVLYMAGGFFPIVIAMIIVGFVGIIYKYPQYRTIRDFMDKLY